MNGYAPSVCQPSLPGFRHLDEAVEALATSGAEERGAVFTKPEVVDFILDLVGYTPDQPLHRRRLLEPSFGGGDFLLAVVERLFQAYRSAKGQNPAKELTACIRAVELHKATFAETRQRLLDKLDDLGCSQKEAQTLAGAWLVRDDFLLTGLEGGFEYVVGNPPYVRPEALPPALMGEYRRRYSTLYDRADLYIPFIERSLGALVPGGVLGFICADRWMKNRYGGPLRRLVADHYHLRAYIDMVGTSAFSSQVTAYPAIFVIAREQGTATRLARRPNIETAELKRLSRALTLGESRSEAVREVGILVRGDEPWLLEASDSLELVRRLEGKLPTLEEAGCKVGIGVATGADQAFIAPLGALDVEEDCKLPLVMTRDLQDGSILWRGFGVVNPFQEDGGLVALENYPRLRRYLEAHKTEIAGRHVARKAPGQWYRTIDRIYPALVSTPKLLIPDIKGEAHIVYDEGRFYPHHNLYYITSTQWELRALRAVLLSGIAGLFISAYSTKMRGGYLRFQAQYLRRIRVPRWQDVPLGLRRRLADAAHQADPDACRESVAELYGLSSKDLGLMFSRQREAA